MILEVPEMLINTTFHKQAEEYEQKNISTISEVAP